MNAARRPAPLVRHLSADLDTPLSVYLKLADAPYSYLLESVQGGEQWGRYSIIGLPCREIIRIDGHTIRRCIDGANVETVEVADPLDWIEQYAAANAVPALDGLPRLTGGLVGYFGYDTVRLVEPRLAQVAKSDPIAMPDIWLMRSDELVVYDNLAGEMHVIVHPVSGKEAEAQRRLDEIVHRVQAPLPPREASGQGLKVNEADFQSGFDQPHFESAVETIRDYISAGDVMQVVLSQRLSVPFEASPLDLYRALRRLNPSPYMYYMNLGDSFVVGASPEILVRVEDAEVTLRPIAGTRPRGATPDEDLALERDLLADPKELAEHLMLIDLGRNDVGRVAETGSVELTDRMIVERYSHVMHIVSNVTGRLRNGLTAMDALRAALPAGTLSGAPKVRAMEIIDELEPVKRGVYGGAVGYLAWNGNMDTAIAIRTAVIKDGQLHLQAGAGIVADSVPATEWEETMNKARAVIRAAGNAAGNAADLPVNGDAS